MQCNSKVDIIRFSKVQDSLGGWSEAEGILYQDLPCRINWSRGSERIQFDRNTYYRDARLYCRVIDVTTRDRVRYDGAVYEIVHVANADNMNRYLALDLRLKA